MCTLVQKLPPKTTTVPISHPSSINQLPHMKQLNKAPTVKIMHLLDSMFLNMHNSSELRPYLRCPSNAYSQPTFSYLKTEDNSGQTGSVVTQVDRNFTMSSDLCQNRHLVISLKHYHKMHSVYFMNILNAVLKNTVKFIPDFPEVSDDVFLGLSSRIYRKYFWFITYSQIAASYDNEHIYRVD